MHTSTMTTKGQVTIPASLRELLGLHPGDKVAFRYHDHEIIILKQKDDISTSFGLISVDKEVPLEAIQQAIEEGPVDDIT